MRAVRSTTSDLPNFRIGDSMIMISGPEGRDPNPAFLYVYVPDTNLSY
jgi:hypothetical protein